jgi:hypothetical protein
METVNDLTKCCATCPYWNFVGNDQALAIGECRHAPPVIIMMPAEHKISHQVTLRPQAMFPQITGTAWCGKHPARQGEESRASKGN